MTTITETEIDKMAIEFAREMNDQLDPLRDFKDTFFGRRCPNMSEADKAKYLGAIYEGMTAKAARLLRRAVDDEWTAIQELRYFRAMEAGFGFAEYRKSVWGIYTALQEIHRDERVNPGPPVGEHSEHLKAAARKARRMLYEAFAESHQRMLAEEALEVLTIEK